ncbi:MAG: hypothetical protein BroJett007_10960 [Chloroflexota bacterium]|nr:MAG: hypothetical protein BroJett007_10960 [Chloroflexota bacterium]
MSLNILIIISNPIDDSDDPLSFADEWQAIARAFAMRNMQATLIRLSPPTSKNLFYSLQHTNGSIDVMHFIGHGDYDGLVLEDELGNEEYIDAIALADVLKQAEVELVVLNVCESQGPAEALFDAGMRTVLGTTESIEDLNAVLFADEFYSSLASGLSVAQAIERVNARLEDNDSAAMISLFGDSSLSIAVDEQSNSPVITRIEHLPPNNLVYSGTFWGRTNDLKTGMGLLADTSCRAIQIVGIGGAGKTAFSAQLAERSAWRFPGGIVWVRGHDLALDLEGLLIPVVQGILTLENSQQEAPKTISGLEEVIASLNSRPCLLIIDDADRLSIQIQDELKLLVDRLSTLTGSKLMLVLEKPIFDSLSSFVVAPLALGGLDVNAGLRFLERIAYQQGIIELTLLSRDETETLLRRVDFNPKMIQLLAGYTKACGLEEARKALEGLSGSIAHRIEELLGRTVATLNDDEKRILQVAALFEGSFNLSSVRWISQLDDVVEQMSALAGRTLVQYTPFAGEYSIQNLTRDFVRARLLPSPVLELRFTEHILIRFKDLVATFAIPPHSTHTSEISKLILELKSSVRRLEKIGENAALELVVRVSETVRDYLHFEIQDWTSVVYFEQAARRACEYLGDSARLGQVLTSLAAALVKSDDVREDAVDLCNQGIGLLEPFGNAEQLAVAYGGLGFVLRHQSKLAEAQRAYERALKFAVASDSTQLQIRHLGNLGTIFRYFKDFNEARALYEKALDLARKVNDLRLIALQLDLLGLVARAQGRLSEAYELHAEAFRLKVTTGDRTGLWITRNNLSQVLKSLDRAEEASEFYEDVMQEIEQEPTSMRKWHTLLQIARLNRQLEDFAKARKLYSQARAIAQELSFRRGVSICERGLALCYSAEANYLEAHTHINEAISWSDSSDEFLPTLLTEATTIQSNL